MKNVKINRYQIGLVFKDEIFVKILTEGSYWCWNKEVVKIYNKGTLFNSPIELNLLLEYPEVAKELDVIEVADNEIAIQFDNNLFKMVLNPGQYAFWKGHKKYMYVRADLSKIEITEPINKHLVFNKLTQYIRTYTIESYEKGLLIVNGQFKEILESGTYHFWKNSTVVQMEKVDVRQMQMEVSGQEILTKDKASLRLNCYVQYVVVDVIKTTYMHKDHEKQLYVLIQLALREYVGGMTLDELLDKKEALAQYVVESTAEKVKELGVAIKTCGVKDIILPGDMKDIMNQVLMAEKKAQANIIMRREETASMRSLLNTAKLMEENTTLWKLKEMEYVEKIAEKINTISVSGNGQILDQLKQIFVKT